MGKSRNIQHAFTIDVENAAEKAVICESSIYVEFVSVNLRRMERLQELQNHLGRASVASSLLINKITYTKLQT